MAALMTMNVAPNMELLPLLIVREVASCMLLADDSSGWELNSLLKSLSLKISLAVMIFMPRPLHRTGPFLTD